MNTCFPLSIISSILLQCETIDSLIINACYNKEILNDIGVRIKTCSAMLKFLEPLTLTSHQERSGQRLFSLLESLSEIVFKISDESLLINI